MNKRKKTKSYPRAVAAKIASNYNNDDYDDCWLKTPNTHTPTNMTFSPSILLSPFAFFPSALTLFFSLSLPSFFFHPFFS